MNKGLKLRFCKECNRKRYCQRIQIPDYNFRFICSKGHEWILQGVTSERIQSALTEIILPNIKNSFERDDTFFKELGKRK